MKQLYAFFKKELLELTRTGKLYLLLLFFLLVGIMSPALAKLLPWLVSLFSAELEESGMILTEMNVDALTSWTQYYKNLPLVMILFVVIFGGIFTLEYQRGTLVNMLTKGLDRWKILFAKTGIMLAVWTAGYAVCCGVSFGYTVYFWDNSILSHLGLGLLLPYLFGIWLISLIVLFSVLSAANTAVILCVGAVTAAGYLLQMIPAVSKYVPLRLMSALELISGAAVPSDYGAAALITLLLSAGALILSVVLFNRKTIF